MTETHPVLNRAEFIALSAHAGYAVRTSGRMFGFLARDWQQEMQSGPRTATDICYEEQTPGGDIETVVSIRNMYTHLESLEDIRGVGPDLRRFCSELIDAAMQQA